MGDKASLPDYESTIGKPPAYEEEVAPTTLIMNTDHISSNGKPLYSISRSLTNIKQEPSSIRFERIEHVGPEKPDSSEPPNTFNTLLFYLVHPVNAQYQKDKPAYFATCDKELGIGNIIVDFQKKALSKTEYKVLLSPENSASSDPLFSSTPITALTAKTGFMGGKYSWIDSQGKVVAHEELGSDKKQQLKITGTLKVELRDALVAAWCLKIWSDVAESREAKRDGK